MKLVNTEAKSPLETLWRQFPEIASSVIVGRVEVSGGPRHDGVVIRTFRLLDGRYVEILSTEAGNEIRPMCSEMVDHFEDAWRHLGRKVIASQRRNEPHGILWASDEFFELTE